MAIRSSDTTTRRHILAGRQPRLLPDLGDLPNECHHLGLDRGFLDELAPELIVAMTPEGRFSGDVLPSSEWRFHRDILMNRPDADAVVHCHAMFATTLAILRKEIPPIHYMIAAAGGAPIRCAPSSHSGRMSCAPSIR